MDRDEWLRRFRARLQERNPSIPDDVLAGLASTEAYDALSATYPDNPEEAVDDPANDLLAHHK